METDARQISIWLAACLGLIVTSGLAASGLGALGVAIVLLPVAMVGYSAAMTAAATGDERREIAAIERANADLRRFVLGETSTLVGIAREQQHAIHAGYDGAIRAALETTLSQARSGGDARGANGSSAASAAATGGW
jgi:hypothetical protein